MTTKPLKILIILLLFSNVILGQEYERYNKLLDTTIFSKYLKFDKRISVTVPFEWQENSKNKYPLIIIFDKQNNRSHQYILNTIDYLTSNEQMPSAIIISVESEQKYRYLETQYNISSKNGLAHENENFIFNELIPFAESKLNASSFRLLIGHSRYGYFTTSLFYSKINDINAIISISPFYKQKNVNLIDSIAILNTNNINSYKYYRFGIGNDYPTDFNQMDSAIIKFKNSKINANGYLFKNAEHNVTPGLTIGSALYEIFDYWSEKQSNYFSNDNKKTSTIHSLENDISNHYGCNLRFDLGVLNGKGWYFYNASEFRQAIMAWEILIENYPNFSAAYLYIMDAQIRLNINTDKTENDFKNSLINSKIYSEKEKQELLKEMKEMKEM